MADNQTTTLNDLTPTQEEWEVVARSHQAAASDAKRGSPAHVRHTARFNEIVAALPKVGGWFGKAPE